MSALISPQITYVSSSDPFPAPSPTIIAVVPPPLLAAPRSASVSATLVSASGSGATALDRSVPASGEPLPAIFDRISYCESGGRQYDANGNVIRGVVNPNDVGKYQINLAVWGREAKKLGIDVFTEEGNEQMALMLYERHGTQPWNPSKSCWSR